MNKPLTVDELKVLKENDWVWTVYLKSNTKQYHCIAENKVDCLLVRDKVCCLDLVRLNYSDYGIKWIAYKNKEQAESDNTEE